MSDKPRYNPAIHHRRSIRLKGYDYSQAGAYFFTICTDNRACLFGEIVVEAGLGVGAGSEPAPTTEPIIIESTIIEPAPTTEPIIIESTITEPIRTESIITEPAPTGCTQMRLNEYGEIIQYTWEDLINHVGGIVLDAFVVMPNHIHGIIVIVGEAGLVRGGSSGTDPGVGAGSEPALTMAHAVIEPAPTGVTTVKKCQPLSEIVRQFKTFSARRINEKRHTPGAPVWQRNYWEHIIRNEKSYNEIAAYIANNPAQWELDKLFVGEKP